MSNVDDILSDTPAVDKERIDRVYSEIDDMEDILLDPDPLGSGPAKVNRTRSRIRNQMTRCTALELQILQDMGWFKHEITRLEAQMEMKIANLLATDPKVKMGRSTDDRRALAEVELKDDSSILQVQKRRYDTLEIMVKVVRVKKADLKNLQTQLRDQMKTCEHELGLGRTWGMAPPRSATGENELSRDLEAIEDAVSVREREAAAPRMAPVQVTKKSVVANGGLADLDDLLDRVSDPEADLHALLDGATTPEEATPEEATPEEAAPEAAAPEEAAPEAAAPEEAAPEAAIVILDPAALKVEVSESPTDLEGLMDSQDLKAVPAGLAGRHLDTDIEKALSQMGGDVPTTVVSSVATAPSSKSLDDILAAFET